MSLSLVDLIERSSCTFPERIAIVDPGGPRVTYAELDQASRRIAMNLLSHGVSRGDRVGLLVPKSAEAVVCLWGILRAGAAYVPIDTEAPAMRAALIASDCQMKAVLASSELAETLSAIHESCPNATILPMEELRAEPESKDICLPCVNVRDLAYILYTSGSTGDPKGVMISHGAALSFVEWAVWKFELGPLDVLSNHAPFHFDLSVFDIFGSASAGASVVVMDAETTRFPMAAAGVLESEKISVWYSVPGALRKMLRLGRMAERELRDLRIILFAGEPYPEDDLRLLQGSFPGAALYNLYGPTETNVCTYWSVPPAVEWSSVSIGFDCENCQGVVVDESLVPVPDGSPGELLVRGGTVMEGYWGDSVRTSAAFVRNFLYPHLSDWFYRTGDIVARQRDGSYSLVGRADHQVKVRGYRVELGEVESALQRIPGIVEATVVAATGGGDTELVAFVVESGEGSPDEAELSKQLHIFLPKYMIPGELRRLKELPTTSTGKVDRRALARLAHETKFGDPST